jgi:CheY-like chemotaxis protein
MRILVLDDDQILLDALKAILNDYGHDVDTANTAKDAITPAEKGNYDFILVDYKMPENDGIWFMKNIKLPKNTKVLLITAYVNRAVINQMFELGASGYLIKPFDDKELIRHLEFYSQK